RFRASRETGKALLGILAQTGRVSRALRAMHSTGFLGRLLPEWSRLTFLAQHDHYHTYTVDEHTLRALELLDEVATSDDPALQSFRRLLEETPEPEILYLALLLHDIGKGRGVSHVPMGARLAERICRQLHLRSEAAQEVVFLVRQHLLMSQLSQRRDLSEESVLQGFVAKVADLPRLNRLMLLTYVDHRAVGPNVWNDWKASLLWDLYKQARVLVAGGEPARWDEDRRLRARQRLVQALMPRVAASLIERHLALMPDKYLRTIDAERLEMHLGLIERLGLQPVTTHWHPAPLGHSTELTVCTRDARGLLARLSGTLSAHGLDILSVDLFTREDGFVLDTFRVRARGGQQAVAARLWRAIDDDLTGALRGDYDVPRAIAAWREKNPPQAARRAARRHASPKISFDCEASPDNTVVEVEAEDQPGLVYTIAHTLSLLGMNITFAKIATEKSHALDVFYLTGARGAKLTLTEMESVSNALRQALTGPRAPQGVSSKEDR
ncbi:MAG: HD domain-containing protein, partial [Vicinamibacteria bacterium]|nr:HD domain-containing protein [Vicinamibacteria bacterium]